ncbi:MAG TPA: triphosphoribosyl-dephospho-CoA synthase [Clostridia bacterium]|nr:triphosphoribosyl-dephospho-CoA synthase [Clostridia bacterium]
MLRYIDKITKLAVESLYEELDTTPKPGLVDRVSSGAHSDMSYPLFVESIKAITPYLREFAVLALGNTDTHSLALSLKETGKKAEKAMFAATKNINTHKGAIFALGMIIGALVSKNVDGVTGIKALSRQIKNFALELEPLLENGTHGSLMREKYGVRGAFGQALDGYEKVLNTTLPLFCEYPLKGYSKNDTNILVLLKLITILDDTNVLYRVGESKYKIARDKASALLDKFSQETLQCLCVSYKENNISFGGCADMLMLSIFAQKLYEKGFLAVE